MLVFNAIRNRSTLIDLPRVTASIPVADLGVDIKNKITVRLFLFNSRLNM